MKLLDDEMGNVSVFFGKKHVLYLDVMGFSDYVRSEYFDYKFFVKIFETFDEIIRQYNDEVVNPEEGYVVNPKITYCSDSIVVSTEASEIDAIWLCELVESFYNIFLDHGFLIRGAVVTGDIYHSGNKIFGPAMLEAVDLEKKIRMPIVAMSRDFYDIFHLADNEEDKEIVQIRDKQLISKYNLDSYFVDPFYKLKFLKNDGSAHIANIEKINKWKNVAKKELNNPDKSIRDKYVWLSEYFNHCFAGGGFEAISTR